MTKQLVPGDKVIRLDYGVVVVSTVTSRTERTISTTHENGCIESRRGRPDNYKLYDKDTVDMIISLQTTAKSLERQAKQLYAGLEECI